MNAFIASHQILAFGIGISLMYIAAAAVALAWAIKTGQFRNQDHARYLPLEAREIGEDAEKKRNC